MEFFPELMGEILSRSLQARELSEKLIRPTIAKDDETSRFPREIFESFGKAGIVGQLLPKEFSGSGDSFSSYYPSIDEVAQASVCFAVVIGVTNLVMGGILKYGNPEQKKNYLPKLAQGEWLGAFSLSEPNAGSDASGLSLQARKVDKGYRLTGTKCWCSNAGYADLYLVMGRTSPDKKKGITSFLVKKDTPGFKVGKHEHKLGLKSSSLGELIFEDCFVPDADVLGKEGQGFEVALSQLESGRIGIATCGLGAATRSLDVIFPIRAKMKDPETGSDGVLDSLSEYYARLLALKSLMHTTIQLKDAGKSKAVLASSLKLLATDLAMEVSSFALGNLPLEKQAERIELERIFRDSKALQIVEGTNQIQKVVIAREMEKQK